MMRKHCQQSRLRRLAVPMIWALLAIPLSPAFGQDIRGLEVCIAEKQMDRRTACLQSNVEFLQQLLTKLARDTQDKIAASGRDLGALREDVAVLKSTIAKLNADLQQMKTKFESTGKK